MGWLDHLADVGMRDGLGGDDLFWWAAGALTVTTLVTVLIKPVRAIRRFFHRIGDFLEDWFGRPADTERGTPPQPGIMLRLRNVEAEVSDNHGSSLKDHIARIGRKVNELEHKMTDLKTGSATAQRQDEINTKLDDALAHIDSDEPPT